jgi:hypothetical protein
MAAPVQSEQPATTEDLPEDYDYMKIKADVTEIMHNDPILVNIFEEFCIRIINTLYYTIYSDNLLYSYVLKIYRKYVEIEKKMGTTLDEINKNGIFYFNNAGEYTSFANAINNLLADKGDRIINREVVYKQFFVFTLKGGRALRTYIDFLNTKITSQSDKISPDEVTDMLGKKSDYDSNLLINPNIDDMDYFTLYTYLKQLCWKVLYGSLNDGVFQTTVSNELYNKIIIFFKEKNIDISGRLKFRNNKGIKNWDGSRIDNISSNNISGRVQVSRINSFEGIIDNVVNGKLFELLRLMTTFIYLKPDGTWEAFDGELIDISFIPKYYTEKPIIVDDKITGYVVLSETDGAKLITYGDNKYGIPNERAIADWDHSKKNIYKVTNLTFYQYTFICSYTLDDLLDDIKRVISETELGFPMGADITKLAKRKKRYGTLIKLLCTRPETMKIEKLSPEDLLDKCTSTLQTICANLFEESDWEFLYPFLFQKSSASSKDILQSIFIYYSDQYYQYLIINPFGDILLQIKNLSKQVQFIKLVNNSQLMKEYINRIFDELDAKFGGDTDQINKFCCNCILHFNRLMNSFNDEILRLGVIYYFLSGMQNFKPISAAEDQPIEVKIIQFIGQIQNNIRNFYELRGKSITYPILRTFSSQILTSIIDSVKLIPTPNYTYTYSLRIKGGLAFEMIKNVINNKPSPDAYDETFQTNDLDLQLFIERTPKTNKISFEDRYFSDNSVIEQILIIISNIAKNLTVLTNNQFLFYPNIINMGGGALRIQLICINSHFTREIDPVMGEFQPLAFQHILELDITFLDDPGKKEKLFINYLPIGKSGIYIDSPFALYNTFNQILNENLYYIRKEKYLNRISILFGKETLSFNILDSATLTSEKENLQLQLQQTQIEKQQYAAAIANFQFEQMAENRKKEIVSQLNVELALITADPRAQIVLTLPGDIKNLIAINYANLRLLGLNSDTAFIHAISPFSQLISVRQLDAELKAITADPRIGIVLTLPDNIKNQIALIYANQRLKGNDPNISFQLAIAPFNQLITLQPQIISRKQQAQQQLTAIIQNARQRGYTNDQILTVPNVQTLQKIIASPTAGLAGGNRSRHRTQRRPRYTADRLEKKMEEVLAAARRRRRAHTHYKN